LQVQIVTRENFGKYGFDSVGTDASDGQRNDVEDGSDGDDPLATQSSFSQQLWEPHLDLTDDEFYWSCWALVDSAVEVLDLSAVEVVYNFSRFMDWTIIHDQYRLWSPVGDLLVHLHDKVLQEVEEAGSCVAVLEELVEDLAVGRDDDSQSHVGEPLGIAVLLGVGWSYPTMSLGGGGIEGRLIKL
jgi:hypothetical protein